MNMFYFLILLFEITDFMFKKIIAIGSRLMNDMVMHLGYKTIKRNANNAHIVYGTPLKLLY